MELIRKIKSDEMKLEEIKKLRNIFKSNLNEISIGRFKLKEEKGAVESIKLLTSHEKLLLNYLMIILQLHLKLNIKQNMEKDWKYQFLNKSFKDYQ